MASLLRHELQAVKNFLSRERFSIVLTLMATIGVVLALLAALSFTTSGSLPTGASCSGVVRRVTPFSEVYNIFVAVEFDTAVCVFSVRSESIAVVPLGVPLKITQRSWRRIAIAKVDHGKGYEPRALSSGRR